MTDNMIETVEITKDFGKLHVLKGINQHVASIHHRPVGLGQIHVSALPEPA